MDTELDEPSMDLLDESTFEEYTGAMQSKKFHASVSAMPCSSFSAGRNFYDGGPQPLRGYGPVDIYGLPGLTLHDKETVRIGSLLALRGSTMAKICNTLGVPWVAETPELRD